MTGSVFLEGPGVVAFYSYATGVSLELPVGFTAEGEDATSATYVRSADDRAVRVQVRVVGSVPAESGGDAARSLADGFEEGGKVLSRRGALVDGVTFLTVRTRRTDGWLQHSTVGSDDGTLISVVALWPPEAEDADDLPAQLDTAIDSIRLVKL